VTATAALVTRARDLYALAWCGKSPALRQDATAALDATMRDLHDADEAVWRATVDALVAMAGELAARREGHNRDPGVM
jgi:hypothetical protein